MKKYLFLLLAFVGLSVSAQSYETNNALFHGDSEITQIERHNRAVLTFSGNKLVFTFRHSGQSFIYYYHKQTVFKSTGVMDVYKSATGDSYVYVDQSRTIASVDSGDRIDAFGLTPSSVYFYVMGDKGDDEEDETQDIPYGWTLVLEKTESGKPMYIGKGPNNEIVLAIKIDPKEYREFLTPAILEGATGEVERDVYDGFVTYTITFQQGTKREMSTVYIFDDGNAFNVTRYSKNSRVTSAEDIVDVGIEALKRLIRYTT